MGHMGHGNGNGNNEDTDMFSPLQTHAYPSFEAAGRAFRQPQAASTMASTVTPAYMGDSNGGFSIGFDMPSIPSTSNDVPSSSALYDPTSLPFYSGPSSSGNTMFDSNNQGGFPVGSTPFSHNNHHHQQSSLTPIGDLLGLGSSSFSHGYPSMPNLGSGASTSSNDTKKKPVPPPKPPKRILPQSTGSSSSSGVSQSLKPPVPKKPTRLTENAPPRWIAPRPDTSLAASTVSLIPSSSGPDMYYSGTGKPSDVPPPAYSATASGPLGGSGSGRHVKVLQPQQSLYGMGTLSNSLGVEQQIHAEPPPLTPVSESSERYSCYEGSENALQYLQSKCFRVSFVLRVPLALRLRSTI